MVQVVAALIWREERFLICQRPADKARGLLWEFVGGKVEEGETPEEALVGREILILAASGGAVRGLGRSFQIMLVSLFGACGLRLIWVFFFLPLNRTLRFLYVAYPVSWGVTFAVAAALFLWLTQARRLEGIIREKAAPGQ